MSCCGQVFPPNAARPFKAPAEILKKAAATRVLKGIAGGRIIEVGAGCLRNALYLQKRGYTLTVLEVQGIEQRFAKEYQRFRRHKGIVVYSLSGLGKFDAAVATFVVETICKPSDRVALLKKTRGLLEPGGFLLLSVRGPADLVTAKASGQPCSDGFITPGRTFSRAFDRKQLAALLAKSGFSGVEFLHKATTKAPEYLHALAKL